MLPMDGTSHVWKPTDIITHVTVSVRLQLGVENLWRNAVCCVL